MKTRFTRSKIRDVLAKCCPSCGNDLELHDLKKWFTLYFIPIFPYSTIESCYKCAHCAQTYKQSVKQTIVGSSKERDKLKKEAQKTFATTLAACMTHMAKIDGSISREERKELEDLSKKFKEFSTDIKKTIDKISKSKKDDDVFDLLSQARNILTAEGIMLIIGQVARVLLADGKIDKKEESLMKEYLLVCGIPRDLFNEIVDKVKKGMN